MSCFVVSVTLCIQWPLFLSNSTVSKVSIVAGMDDMHGLKNMNFPLLRTLPLLGAQSFDRKDQHVPMIWHRSLERSAAYLVAG